MTNDPLIQEANERLGVLQRAQDFQQLLKCAGWDHLQQEQARWLLTFLSALKDAKTASVEDARDALRRWQIAEELIDLQTSAINSALAQAEQLRGNLDLQGALLMEYAKHEQSNAAAESESRTDRTGY